MEILTKGKIGETYLIGANGEKNNKKVLELMGQPKDAYDHDLRYASTPLSCRLKSVGNRSIPTSRPASSIIDWYTEHEDWQKDEKAAVEAKHTKNGQ